MKRLGEGATAVSSVIALALLTGLTPATADEPSGESSDPPGDLDAPSPDETEGETAGDAARSEEVSNEPEAAESQDEDAFDDEESEEEEDEESEDGEKGEKWGGRKRDHNRQGGVDVTFGTGYFMVAPYNKNDPDEMCEVSAENANEGEPVCGGRTGIFMEFMAGYGLKPGLELLSIFRLGLEQPTKDGLLNQPKVRQVGVGVRFFKPKDGLFKLGVGVAPLFDFSDRSPGPTRYDLIFHVPFQLHFDVLPWVAPYVHFAANLSFIAEFRFEFTGGAGVQGRFP